MGFRGRHKNKRDANEGEIVASLRAHGFTIYHLDQPVDLVAGFAGKDYLIEVKSLKGDLTGPQKEFFDAWDGGKVILRSAEEADEFAQKIRGQK